jgi:hypothetical protein
MKARVKFLGSGIVGTWVDENEVYPVAGDFWEGDEHILRIIGGGRVNFCKEHGCSHLGGGDWELVE